MYQEISSGSKFRSKGDKFRLIIEFCFFVITDMIKRRVLRTRAIKMLVLDESDEMLNKGFKEQIYDVYRYLPPATQVVLVSATLPHEILEMTSKFMTDPIRILVKRYVITKIHFIMITVPNRRC